MEETIKNFVATFKKVPSWTKLGVLGVVFTYTAMAGVTSAAIPWWIGKGDSALHIDYALSIYNREIPQYHDYVQYPVFHQLDKGYKTQIQRAATNPPLFYIMHAPIVGPLLNSGRWKPAIALGRAFNVFLGILTVLALAWAGWLLGGRRKQLFAVAVPAVATASYQFTNLNQNYAVDVLLVLLGVLTIINWYKLLEFGFLKHYVVSLFILSILGMSTKASYVIFLGLSFLTIMITAYFYTKGNKVKKLFSGSMISGLLLAAVTVCIGWFYYYWNYRVSGNIFDAELPGDFGSRIPKSLSTVLTHNGLWSNFYMRYTSSVFWSQIVTLFALGGILLSIYRTKLSVILKDKKLIAITFLLISLLGATTLTQIMHAWGIGNFSFRYFLPALLVFSLFISYGLLEIRRARGQLISIAFIGMISTSVITLAKLDNTRIWVPEVTRTNDIYGKLDIAMASNGFPPALLVLITCMMICGLAVVTIALFKLSSNSVEEA